MSSLMMSYRWMCLSVAAMAYYSNAQIVQKHLIDEFLGSLSSQLEILFTTQGESFITAATKCTYRCKDIRQCIGFEICKIREDLYQCRACCAWKKLGQERTNNNLNTCRYLRMVEKENIDKINVAVNKPASIISLYDPRYHHASNAVDNVTVCENGLSTAHTKKEINPWIKIDLQNTFDVVEVLVYNRQDSFGNRLHDLLITVDENYCCSFEGPALTGDLILFLCSSGSRGRIVTLMIQSKEGKEETLNLCEVQIFVRL